jgi:hypothetical protein
MAFGDTILSTVLGKPSVPEDTDATANAVAEGAAVNTYVGITAHSTFANGNASLDYSLGADSSGGGFKIDPSTGMVTVADPSKIDFESAPGHAYTITVVATKNGSFSSEQTFTISVNDVAPSTPVDSNPAANTVLEGAAAGTTVGITASASDVNGGAITWSLTGDSSGGGFTINPTTGVITVADGSKIDYESSAGHAYTVTATASDGTLTHSQTFTINVGDVAMTTPVDSNGAANSVAEGASAGTTVGITAQSSDPSGPATTYSLIGDTSGGGFTINSSTGVVTVADPSKIDFESTAPGHTYSITVQASNGAQTTSQSFSIGVTDVAPSAPTDTNPAANSVAEGAAVGTVVGVTAHSTDVNGGAVTYSLIGDTSGGGFTINSSTGVITVADPTKIDYETAAGHAYTVTARASDGTLTSSQAFTIGVSDVAPSTPVDNNAGTNTVAEGAANGTAVGITAQSTDVNGPGVTYSLTGDTSGGGFAINSTTGVVTVANSSKIDYETAPGHIYSVNVTASDGALSSSQSFSIAVTDVASSTPTDTNNATNIIAEGAANGSTVGITASSTDPNGPAASYALTDNAGGRFAINSTTGVVTVANGAAIDFETAPGAGHTYSITVQGSSGALSSTQNFTIGVTDVAPSAPSDSDNSTNSVFEGAANGTAVGITASSSDPGGGPAPTFTLTDNAGGRFAINSTTGVVTVANGAAIDFETAPGAGHSYGIIVQATAGALSSTQNFTINVGDVAPSAPVDSDGGTNTVAEGAANGSSVGVTANSTDVNGPGVTYSLTGDTSGGGFTINSTTGVITVADGTKLDYETTPSHNYTVTAQASDGTLTNSQTFNIALTDVAPSAPNDVNGATNTIAEGAANGSSVGITASSSDPNGPATTYALTDDAGGRFAINAGTGVVTVANGAAIDFETGAGHTYSITVQGSSGALSSTQNFTIGVTDVAPSTPSDSDNTTNSVFEGAANGTAVGITASSSDPGGGPAPIFTLTDNAGGRFAIDSTTGVVTIANGAAVDFETAPGAGHSYGITVQASAGALSSTQNFTILVGDVNEAPAGTDKTVTMLEGDSYTFSTADFGFSDPSDSVSPNSLLAVKMTTVPGAGTGTFTDNGVTVNANDFVSATDIAAGLLVFTPTAHSNGAPEASFTFQVQDNGGTAHGGVDLDQSPNTISINVNAVNDAPINSVPLATQSVNEEAALTFSAGGGNAITISDVDVGSGNETVTLTVGHGTLALGSTAGLVPGFTNNAASITLSGTVANINAALDGLTYTGDLDFHGNDTLVVGTNDNGNTGAGGPKTDSDNVSITVNDVADTPSVTNATTNEDTQSASGLVVSRNATDGTDVAFFKITGIANGTLFQNDGVTAINNGDFITFAEANAGLKFTPSADFYGNGSFNVQASTTNSNAGLGGSLATATITVDPVADTASVTNATTNEDTQSASGLVVSRNAVDGAEVDFVKITNISNGTLFLNDGTTQVTNGDFISVTDAHAGLKFTPTADFFGNGSFDVQASIGNTGAGLGGAVQTATVTVSPVADSPSVTNATTNEDTQSASGLVVTRNAVDGAEVGFVKITNISNGTLFQNDGITAINNGDFITYAQANAGLKFTPAADFFGNGSFDVQASTSNSDAGLGGSVQSATIAIDPVNDAPSLTSHDRDPVYAAGVQLFDSTSVSVGPANESTQNIKQLVLTVSNVDGSGTTDHLSIDGTNVFLTDGNSQTGVNHGVSISVALSAGTATVTISKAGDIPAADVASIVDALTYTNDDVTGGEAARHVTLTSIQDNGGISPGVDTTALSIDSTVSFNLPPAIDSDGSGATAAKSVAENTTAVTTVHATDPDNGPVTPLSYSLVGGDDQLKFAIDSTSGALTFIAAPDFENPTDTSTSGNNTYIVTVRASDGASFDDQTITVTVTDVNEAPVITSNAGGATASINVNENSTAVTTVTATDQDTPAQTLTYSLAGGADQGKFSINSSSGVLTFNTAPNFEAPTDTGGDNGYDVIVRVTDNGSPNLHDDQAITVHVQDVNEAPDTAAVSATGNEDPTGPAYIAITITGADPDTVAGDSVASFHITNIPNGGTQGTLYSNIGLTTAVTEGADVTASGNAATLYFVPNANFNTHAGAVTFNAASTDSHGLTDATPATETINVTAVNDAPVNNGVPASFIIGSGFSHAITGLSISDVDANEVGVPTDITTTLAAGAGTVTVGNGASGTNAGIAGGATITTNASGSVVLTGSIAQINTTLGASNGVVYNAADNAGNTTTSITMTTNDHGHNGSGGALSDVDVINVGVIPQVWFINNDQSAIDATATRGSQANPFGTIAEFNGSSGPGINDYIYIKQGTAAYAGDGINLKAGQTLLGDDQALSFTNPLNPGGPAIVIEDATGARPTINVTTASDQGIALASGNTVAGIVVTTGAATTVGIDDSGASVGTLSISDTDVTGTGQAINITHGSAATGGSMTFGTVSSGGGVNGIALGGALTTTFSATGGTLSGHTGAEFSSNVGSGNISYGGNIGDGSGNTSVSITGRTGGTVTLSGTITDGVDTGGGFGISGNANTTINFSGTSKALDTGIGDGVSITNNTGTSNINFTNGGLAVQTSNGTAFQDTVAGTVSVTGSANTLATSGTGAILNMSDVSLGASGVTFSSLQSTGTVSATAVLLNNVDGNTFTSGGTSIAGTSGAGNDGIRVSGGSSSAFNFNGTTTVSNTANDGINLSGANGAVTFNSVALNGMTGDAVDISGNTAAVTLSGGTIGNTNDPAGVGVRVGSGTGNVSVAASITKSSAGHTVDVSGHTGGTLAFSGAISGAGAVDDGISLTSNTGATMNFNGGMTLTTGANAAFTATGGGTVNVTNGAGNHLTTTTGTALNVANTTIGASGLTFHDISAGTGASGPASGIILNSTGATGSLTVTGGGSTTQGGDASGGLIQHTTGAGISLTTTLSPSFNNMSIQSTAASGINGTDVTNFSFTNGTINNSGTGHGVDNSNIGFNSTPAGATNNVDGTVTITNNVLSNAYYHGVDIQNRAGTIDNLTISNNAITSATAQANSLGSGIHVITFGTSSSSASLTKATIDSNTLANFPTGAGIAVEGGNSNASGPGGTMGVPNNATNIIAITNNNIHGLSTASPIGSEGIVTLVQGGNAGSRSQGNFNISSNTITDTLGQGIVVSDFGDATVNAKVDSNTVDTNNIGKNIGSNGIGIGTGVVGVDNAATPLMTVEVISNTVTDYDGNGIRLVALDTNGTLNATVLTNSVGRAAGGGFPSRIRIDSGNENNPGNNTINLDIKNNVGIGTSVASDAPGIGLRLGDGGAATNILRIEGLSPSPATDVQTENFVSGNNTGMSAGTLSGSYTPAKITEVIHGSTFFATAGNVPQPQLALHGAGPGSSETLTMDELTPVLAIAIQHWADAGASAAQIAQLEHAASTIQISDIFASAAVAQTDMNGQITIDANAAGWGWFVDSTPADNNEFHATSTANELAANGGAAASHMDLLTAVEHELGHVIGLDDSAATGVMNVNLDIGERRLVDPVDVAHANASSATQAEAALPVSAQAAAGTPIVTGTAGNDTIDAGHGGNILFGGAGADHFVFGPATPLETPTPAQVTHVADYHASEGDSFDFTAITSQFHNSSVSDAMVVRAVEDASGKFATLQVDHIDPMGLPSAPNWIDVAQLDGAHVGDSVNVLLDNHSVHLAQIHVDLLV